MVQAHKADALICISNCDKITPGMLLAALRLNIPTIFVSGGPMEAGKTELSTGPAKLYLINAMIAGGDDTVSEEEVEKMEEASCPTCGSCWGSCVGRDGSDSALCKSDSVKSRHTWRRVVMKIVVLDGHTMNPRGDNSWDVVGELGELEVYDFTPVEQIVERAQGAEVVLTNKTPLSRETLGQLPQLRFISVVATGYNVVDVEAARERDISVSNIPVYGTDSVAQYAIAMLLELCHHIGRHDLAVRQGGWQQAGQFSFWQGTLVELAGKTLGVVGFGRIGRRVAELGHAFGMEIIAYTPRPGQAPDYEPFAFRSMEELFAEADAVSLHCPQTPENAGFVNRELLGRMKLGSFLVNTSRGALVNEADLLEALRAGRPGAAATDVASTEPIQEGNPLLKAPNLMITPHMAWATLEARQRLMAMTVENVKAFQQGASINVVN